MYSGGMRSSRALLIAGLSAISLSGLPFSAQDSVTQEELEAYEKQLETDQLALDAIKAAEDVARADLSVINRQLLAAAQESTRREEQASRIEKRLIDLQVRERAARDQLLADRKGLKDLLAALVAASRKQPPALATHPDNATQAIRSAIIMRDMADDLEARSKTLATEIRQYADLLDAVERENVLLSAEEDILAEKRQEITELAAIKRAAYEDISGEAETLRKRVDALARKAENVRTLLASLEANAPAAPSRKPADLRAPSPSTSSPGRSPISVAVLERLGLPATGQLVQSFGDELPTGRKAEGITLRTRASAQVVAPSDAVIEYAGPFRSYGKMLILRTGDGYHIVLYGLSDVYTTLGQSVLAGEPIGRMTARTDVSPDLHMELRRDGTPEDPQKWMSRGAG
ncbi:MAG: hypothetical protein CMK09_11825 [Ponticaulis sp.]|nr:hypothetical protein [Ponticaulis sp.]|tara:strand:+ start:574 stop:1782 length:1209 start_codon:yes stop_codon:yes gene_type:complete